MITTQQAYDLGYDCGLNGPNDHNCVFKIFSSPENTQSWEKGKAMGELEKARATEERLLVADMLTKIDMVREIHKAYIWGFPITWRDSNGKVEKRAFGWEVEFENNFCVNVGYSSRQFNSYYEALVDALAYFNSNPFGDRSIFPDNG
jgi:hypothetical protein